MTNGTLFDVCWSLIAQANPENELFLSDMSIFWNCNSKLCYYLNKSCLSLPAGAKSCLSLPA